MSHQSMTAPKPTRGEEPLLTKKERDDLNNGVWWLPPAAHKILARYETLVEHLESQLLAARRVGEANEALLCEIAQTAIRAVDSPNFNGPHYRTALREIVALAAATQEPR